ncbi:uncharacterized protein CLUP02_07911 [Colletotrichum lupini]|uniref:Uncharacterized protein n=1 Tax=Colletotrichum lupini TaxID=145971 RepID=A0A9Q8SS34_9PEZI|nr:uncharacterized protein CLUP02_07911 [Colletotrichum lupini]UQC82423.1 hypothetical protein CLUP02_07911 [Colletotrichum lupini]
MSDIPSLLEAIVVANGEPRESTPRGPVLTIPEQAPPPPPSPPCQFLLVDNRLALTAYRPDLFLLLFPPLSASLFAWRCARTLVLSLKLPASLNTLPSNTRYTPKLLRQASQFSSDGAKIYGRRALIHTTTWYQRVSLHGKVFGSLDLVQPPTHAIVPVSHPAPSIHRLPSTSRMRQWLQTRSSVRFASSSTFNSTLLTPHAPTADKDIHKPTTPDTDYPPPRKRSRKLNSSHPSTTTTDVENSSNTRIRNPTFPAANDQEIDSIAKLAFHRHPRRRFDEVNGHILNVSTVQDTANDKLVTADDSVLARLFGPAITTLCEQASHGARTNVPAVWISSPCTYPRRTTTWENGVPRGSRGQHLAPSNILSEQGLTPLAPTFPPGIRSFPQLWSGSWRLNSSHCYVLESIRTPILEAPLKIVRAS